MGDTNRATTYTNAVGVGQGAAAANAITLEAAMVQWAGFTFGKAPENYAMMPGIMYGGAAWAGFPNGMNQIAYTQNFGGGITATVAVEDRRDSWVATGSTTMSTPTNGLVYVGNVRLDQSWGMAAVHGLLSPNSYYTTSAGALTGYTAADFNAEYSLTSSSTAASTKNKQGWAVGSTVMLKLPMLGAGDQLWLTANYADGAMSAIMGGSSYSGVNTASQVRLLGGLVRNIGSLAVTSSTTVDTVKAWNVGGLLTHYWAPQWRSNIAASYVSIDSPTTALTTMQWGDAKLQNYMGSLIYSPAKDLDIGLEVQYANLKNKVQNGTAALTNSTGLSSSNWSTKLRVERNF